MGQAMRAMQYNQAENLKNAVTALEFGGKPISWFRLDDGVMGGQSKTQHVAKDGVLHFKGMINTNGGGFTSVRAPIEAGTITPSMEAVKVRFRGDGKTYKFMLADGSGAGGPFSTSPLFQVDFETKTLESDTEWQEVVIPLGSLVPSYCGNIDTEKKKQGSVFVANDMKQFGFQLSLVLSDGKPNPIETFGEGEFPFHLAVQSIEGVPVPEEK
jgi:NADH dehydrogenase [ubiquinone] 1 alpha subcomplex assembly factor 1